MLIWLRKIIKIVDNSKKSLKNLIPMNQFNFWEEEYKYLFRRGRKITSSNLKLEVQFQFSTKFPTSCHQQTGKVIISSKECLTINNIKRISINVTRCAFKKTNYITQFWFVMIFPFCGISIMWGFYCISIFLHFEAPLWVLWVQNSILPFWSVTQHNPRNAPCWISTSLSSTI